LSANAEAGGRIGLRGQHAQTAHMDHEIDIESLSDLFVQLAALAALELAATILFPSAAVWAA
jgi:hypothetical protein